jgi:uncharacterized integral membrane protein
MKQLKPWKVVALLILILIAVVIVLQNTETVETRVLFFSLRMPRAVLLLVATAIGFALGLVVSLLVAKKGG